MALSLVAMAIDGQCAIDTAEAINVTFPSYVELMKSIGAKLSLQISVGLIIVIVAFGILDMYQRKNTDTAALKAKEERALQELSHILGDFLNNM